MVDDDAIDMVSGEPLFHTSKVDIHNIERREYKNTQSAKTCYPLAICLDRESKDLLHSDDGFMGIFKWCMECSETGLSANGDEPAMKPIKLCGTGDMSWQMKLTCTGGGCKVKKHFCPYCEVHGDEDMFDVAEGDERCSPTGVERPVSFCIERRSLFFHADAKVRGHYIPEDIESCNC